MSWASTENYADEMARLNYAFDSSSGIRMP